MKIFDVQNLKVMFFVNGKFLKAVEGIDLEINSGEIVGLVGESGCGKSITCQSMMKLLPPGAFMKADKLEYNNGKKTINILDIKESDMLKIRGEEIALIAQDPNTSLNPVLTIGEQIDEMFIYHLKMKKKEAKARTIELLEKVGIPDAEKRYKAFPHELSGGQKQRIIIAIAFSLNPNLILADEPTTALDVTVQKQILDLLLDLTKKENKALLLITHDLGLVRKYCDKLYVMYSGKIVEYGDAKAVLNDPKHPYTKALLEAVPSIEVADNTMQPIMGNVLSPFNKPKGCYFASRCKYCSEKCLNSRPKKSSRDTGFVKCHLYDGEKDESM